MVTAHFENQMPCDRSASPPLAAPSRVQPALALVVGFCGIKIIPLVRQIVLLQIIFHVRVAPIKNRADFQRAKIFILGNDVQFRAIWILHFAQRRDPNRRREFLHAALKRFELHHCAEFFQSSFVIGGRNLAVNRVAMRGGNFRQERFEIQLEQFFQLLGVLVSRGTIVAVVNPQHRNVRLHLRGEMQNDRFVRTKIRRDNRAAFGLRDGPLHNFERRFVSQLGIGFGNLFRSHGNKFCVANLIGRIRLLLQKHAVAPVAKTFAGISFLRETRKDGTQFVFDFRVFDDIFPDAIEPRAGRFRRRARLDSGRAPCRRMRFPPCKAARSRSGSRSSG